MKTPASWVTMGLSGRRMGLVVLSVGVASSLSVDLATADVLAGVSVLLAIVVGIVAAYSVAVLPKRSLDRSAIMQAREAPSLAASAAVYLQSTGSRSKTVMMLRSDEPRLKQVLDEAKRRTLLGFEALTAVERSDLVRSDSVSSIITSVARAHGERLQDEGEELEGLVRASLATEESKFPVFLTVSFFLPIMLMILAAVGHHDDPVSMMSLAFVEVVVLDLALSFSSTERRRLSS